MQSIYSKIEEIRQEKGAAALCIVIETKGSTPRKQGAKMIVYADGSVYDTIGGGSIEKDVTEKAVQVIRSGKPVKCTFSLEKDLGMHCGGSMEVYIEPLTQIKKLFIFGAGHIGKALAGFARELDFAVTLIDPRENIYAEKVFEGCNCINKDYFEAIEEADFDENTFLVIVTPKHVYDEAILAVVARKPHAYAGMIGSRRKVELLRKRFLEEHILTVEELDSIDMPVGIPMKAETPAEIAISILARLIDVRNSLNNIANE